jgi:two-component system, OmpR family, sensor histidine kinase CpxA
MPDSHRFPCYALASTPESITNLPDWFRQALLHARKAEAVVIDVDFEAKERGNRVEIVQAAKLAIPGDPNLLRSAIENVLRNAVRFTRSGTSVEIVLQTIRVRDADQAVISIRDHGFGVPEQELANIFRPFYRVTDAHSRDSGGVGLGLAITDRIVRLHCGSIQAVNESDGGLRVEMTFPRTVCIAQ